MEGLIIAAGKGTRLKNLGQTKPLTPLLDIPIIEHVILEAQKSGITSFLVITGYKNQLLETFLKELSARINIPIRTLFNRNWEKENGLSVLQAKNQLKSQFVLFMSDHLFDGAIVRQLITRANKENLDKKVILAVDKNLENPHIDLEDVTKVYEENDRIVTIGKALTSYNCFDTGFFLCSPAIFPALEVSSSVHSDTSLSGAIRVLAAKGNALIHDISGHFWIDVDDPLAYEKAEKYLVGV